MIREMRSLPQMDWSVKLWTLPEADQRFYLRMRRILMENLRMVREILGDDGGRD